MTFLSASPTSAASNVSFVPTGAFVKAHELLTEALAEYDSVTLWGEPNVRVSTDGAELRQPWTVLWIPHDATKRYARSVQTDPLPFALWKVYMFPVFRQREFIATVRVTSNLRLDGSKWAEEAEEFLPPGEPFMPEFHPYSRNGVAVAVEDARRDYPESQGFSVAVFRFSGLGYFVAAYSDEEELRVRALGTASEELPRLGPGFVRISEAAGHIKRSIK